MITILIDLFLGWLTRLLLNKVADWILDRVGWATT